MTLQLNSIKLNHELYSESASQTNSKMTRLVHIWTIDCFSYHCHDELGDHEYLESSKFSPYKFDQAQMQFFLRIHPKGVREENQENMLINKNDVSIFLHLETKKKSGINVNMKLSILKKSEEKFNLKEETKALFNDGKWGWSDFITKETLLNTINGLLQDDQLTIFCEINFIEKRITRQGELQFMESDKIKQVPKSKNLNIFLKSWTHTKLGVDKISHIWTIDNFSNIYENQVKNQSKKYSSIRSANFSSICNKTPKFNLELYPNGIKSEYENYISIYIEVENPKLQNYRILFRISLINSKGEEFMKRDARKKLHSTCNCWGWSKYYLRENLFKSANDLIPNDRLSIYCEIIHLLDIETVSSSLSQKRQLELAQGSLDRTLLDFGRLLHSSIQCDVTFLIGKREFGAHKAILSVRSEVFEKMFATEMEEKLQNRVEIIDIEAEVFDKFLKFVYTGKVNDLKRFDDKLIMVADKYQMTSLCELCESSLSLKLNPETVFEILTLADMCNADKLKEIAIEYIKSEAPSSIIQMESFKAFMKSNPDLAHEVICAKMNDLQID